VPSFTWIHCLVLFLLIFFSTLANAETGDIWLDINVGSKHSTDTYWYKGQTYEYNESNPGIGITYEASNTFDIKGGVYDNSYNQTSLYFAGNIKMDLAQSSDWIIEPGFMFGGATGYHDTPENLLLAPIILPNVSVGYKRVRANFGYAPFSLLPGFDVDVATFQMGIKF
jgi:hypothetical protein